MRTQKALQNIIVSILLGFFVIIINFISQKFFVDILGLEYLGLNGLFTNIISLLAVAELGLGSAIIYHLYKPLHKKDVQTVSSLMQFYKHGYRVIALAIVVLGSLATPLLPLIVGDHQISTNVTVIYFLFILNAAVSYMLSYKRSILYADQKNYIINLVHMASVVVSNVIQISLLITTQSYYLYLIVKIVATLVENLILNNIVNKRYSLDSSPTRLSPVIKADIFTKIKGLAFHQVGAFIVSGSTNIIISVMLGIATVGLYSNYLLIQTTVSSLFSQISAGIKASVGNLLVDVGGHRSLAVFHRLHLANQILVLISVSIFFVASNSFVSLWIGDEFTFSRGVTLALSIMLYMKLSRFTFAMFKDAAGIFYEDRFVPLFESAINIIASVVLIYFLGIAGAFIGTAISSLVVHMYSYPKYVYKGVLGCNYKEYAIFFTRNLMVAVLAVGASYYFATLIHSYAMPIYLQLLSEVATATIVPVSIVWIISRKTDEYRYFVQLIQEILFRKKRSV